MIIKVYIRNHRKSQKKGGIPTKLLISQLLIAKEQQIRY